MRIGIKTVYSFLLPFMMSSDTLHCRVISLIETEVTK